MTHRPLNPVKQIQAAETDGVNYRQSLLTFTHQWSCIVNMYLTLLQHDQT